ncbi:MAG: serine O-acetyltransferase EpsC [Clostridia bacterium]
MANKNIDKSDKKDKNKSKSKIAQDLAVALERDPAAKSKAEIFWTYGGFKALYRHRIAHWFYEHKCVFLSKLIASGTRKKTGVDIHPAAKIAGGVFIDHGVGVVVGETAEIGANVVIYQGVTLGGTGKDIGKRHPTIEDNVMISAGAKVLGPITIGHDSKIGAGSVVLKDVPPHSTVVGVPGRIVRQNNEKISDMNQTKLPDPILEEFARLNKRIETLENTLQIKSCKYSITMEGEDDVLATQFDHCENEKK